MDDQEVAELKKLLGDSPEDEEAELLKILGQSHTSHSIPANSDPGATQRVSITTVEQAVSLPSQRRHSHAAPPRQPDGPRGSCEWGKWPSHRDAHP